MDTNKECERWKRKGSGNFQNEQIDLEEGPSPSSFLDYSPTIFLRCHSKMNNAADKQTVVWQCAFEPRNSGYKHNAPIVFATCGGNSVCVINAVDGSVKTKHYSQDIYEDFTAMAWTTLLSEVGTINILAVAGAKSVIHLLHPDKPVCFAEHSIRKNSSSGGKQKDSIESLIFHPKHKHILFGVFRSGIVCIWDIGSPCPPNYKSNLDLLQTIYTDKTHPACALTFSSHCNMLLCATDGGAVGWLTPAAPIKKMEKFKQRTFLFPYCTNESVSPTDENFVDSIEAIGNGEMIATKCALHGCIYIWNLEDAIKKNHTKVAPVHILKWSTTDNFYMNMGVNSNADVLACGDDKGNLWLYDIDAILSRPPQEHECNKVIEWPEIQDLNTRSEKRKNVIFDGSDIVINKVALSYDANYLVAVTSTNTVCIWKRDKTVD